jgi:hypothetical protein
MDQPPPLKSPAANAVLFGKNQAISALTFEAEGGRLELGAVFHIPTREEAGKTYYKAMACKIQITKEQQAEIINMFQGVTKP